MTGLIVIGVGVTLVDYQQWRHAELDRYGQGWSDLNPPAPALTRLYQNLELGIRMRLPEKTEVDKILKIGVNTSDIGLTDLVRDEAERIKNEGNKLSRDWEYVNTEKINLTVLTWNEDTAGGGQMTRQLVMAKKANRVLKIEVGIDNGDWGKWENTLLEIYKSVEFI